MSSTMQHRTHIEISLPKLRANYRSILSSLDRSTAIVAVVKAEAYGHGAAEVTRCLAEEGCRWVAVSSPDEGISLRKSGIGRKVRVLVLAGVLPGEEGLFTEYRLTPVVHSAREMRLLQNALQESQSPLPIHLKIDTGLHRLGTMEPVSELVQTLQACPDLTLEGLMTHFAAAADFRTDVTKDQTQNFEAALKQFREAGIHPPHLHLASTNAAAYPRAARHDEHASTVQGTLVRVGHALYGYVSPAIGDSPDARFQVQPVLSWKARVLAVKVLQSGEGVGYGPLYRAPRTIRTATLAVGYADGFPHALGNKGRVLIHGRTAPVIGAISMDLTTVDVSDIPQVQPGDSATLLHAATGRELPALEVGRTAGTISYALLSNIHGRVQRVYLNEV
jgi:alanine racemase